MAEKKRKSKKKSGVKVSAKASARASIKAGRDRPVVVVQGSSSSGGGGSSSGGGAAGAGHAMSMPMSMPMPMPMPMPFPNGMQTGPAPVSDWGALHANYRNELAQSLAENDRVHQKIADRFGEQIGDLRRDQAELEGRFKAAQQDHLDDSLSLGNQLHALGQYTYERFGNLKQSRRPPPVHHPHHPPAAAADVGDVFEMAIDKDAEDFVRGEAVKNEQGSTSHSSAPIASADDAIFAGHGNNLSGTRPVPLPTPNVPRHDDGVAESKAGDDDVIDFGPVKQTGPMIDLDNDDVPPHAKTEIKQEKGGGDPPPPPSSALVVHTGTKKRERIAVKSTPHIPNYKWRGDQDEAGLAAGVKKAMRTIFEHQQTTLAVNNSLMEVPIEGLSQERPVSVPIDIEDKKRIALSPNAGEELSLVPVSKPVSAERKVVWKQPKNVKVKPIPDD